MLSFHYALTRMDVLIQKIQDNFIICVTMWVKCTPEDDFHMEHIHETRIYFQNKLAYHSSALLAAYLDTISLNYRQRRNIKQMTSLLQELTPCGRKLLSGTMRLPFPLYAGYSILESLEKFEEPCWTTITPRANVTVESAAKHQLTVRGLSSFALLPR